MNEKQKKSKHSKSHKSKDREKRKKKSRRHSTSSSSSSGSESDEWVEQQTKQTNAAQREDWMSMTGMLKTYTKEDIKPKREEKDKRNIDSYNPGTSSRELNPYWKNGGTGVPETAENFRKSRPFIKPSDDDDDYYSRPKSSHSSSTTGYSSNRSHDKHQDYNKVQKYSDRDPYRRSSNWKKQSDAQKQTESFAQKSREETAMPSYKVDIAKKQVPEDKPKDSKYLSDEKMNKLAAKIVKAEILGDDKLVTELKAKLEAARKYRKENPDAGAEEEDDSVMLIATSASGSSRPLTSSEKGDPRSKSGKRKAQTHVSGERTKYFGDDDKYNLAQMFQQEKYGNNYNDEAELAKLAAKHKNPNDDLEDIFMDNISRNRDAVKESENERSRAISQHIKLERTLEGCEHCVDSKNMLKHLMVSCGNRVYVALPSRVSLVPDHCIITTVQHATCVTSIDEDVWEEIMNYRKALTQFYNSQGKDVVFFETATRLNRHPHMVINCVPLPRDVGDMAAIYFKKALLECEAEWSMNKKVVDLKGKNIRKGIPKGLPYFWIDFGMDPGFAHVIEDQQLFPRNFAEEIIGGILDLDHSLWKNPRRENGESQRRKVMNFVKEWKPFDPFKQ
ncbi:CWF19-like protein 2 homolog [Spodoptera litura]|uniref:CWF19-like protein 2 homolog n=1 Tax=Spodoptera litura TaxID=69820 RepID=A0A9J7EFL0_SPOLT|nr:CWF19-like protein 2 homolog [Spodoptera litura]